jgi:hypothetical protein
VLTKKKENENGLRIFCFARSPMMDAASGKPIELNLNVSQSSF